MPNLLDKVILAVSPERGLQRIKAKAAADVVMNYDAASRGRRTYGWRAPGSDGDAAASMSRARMRNLSRDMIRNRPYAHRGQSVVTANVVGTGIMPSVQMGDKDQDKAVTEVIKAHLLTKAIDARGQNTIVGLQEQVMNAVFADGEVLVRRRLRQKRYNPDLLLPFQIEVVEADLLDTVKTSNGNNEVIDGLEFGPTGEVVAYHLYTQHPGGLSRRRLQSLNSERVPAGQILHIQRVGRPGQSRGVPWLAPVMMTLGEMSDYQEAQVLKQKVASLFAYFIESDEDTATFDGSSVAELAPGAIVGLKQGQKAVASNPPTVDGYDQFMRQGLMAIAMGLDVTYESLSGDLQGVNFSSGRMGRMEMDRMVQGWQQTIMIDQFCDGVAKWCLDFWRVSQVASKLPAPPSEITWTAQRRALIDPSKEIKAAREEIEAGLTSRSRKIREFGNDPDEIDRERLQDAAREGGETKKENENER